MISFNSFITEQQIVESFLDLLILEELTPDQHKQAQKWSDNNPVQPKIKNLHDKAFGEGVQRVTIPIEHPPKDLTGHPLHDEIKSHIEKHGYSIKDYAKNKVIDKHGRETTVNKALNKVKAPAGLDQKYNNDPVRQSQAEDAHTGKSITISRHPMDVAAMSTGRKWDSHSCMHMGGTPTIKGHTEPGANRRYIKKDMEHGTLAAYIHDTDDTELKNPSGRMLLKRHDEFNGGKTIFRPESRQTYGGTGAMLHTLNNWSKKHYPADHDKLYTKHESLYNDDGQTFTDHDEKKFNPKLMDAKVQHIADNHNDGDSFGNFDDGDTIQHKVSNVLHTMRKKLGNDQHKEMDKHLHLDLAKNFHNPEKNHHDDEVNDYSSNPHYSDAYDTDTLAEHTQRHFASQMQIHPEHVDEIAKTYHESWGKHFDGDNPPRDNHVHLEDAILAHGSDKTKADYLHNTHLYQHESPTDSDFRGSQHIVGPHSAKAFYKTHVEPYEESGYSPTSDTSHHGTHAMMAKHADDETFHSWLHSPAVHHNSTSYSAMAEHASKPRQHKMLDDLKFDNGQHNGDPVNKERGVGHGSESKSVLSRIITDKGANRDSRNMAISNMKARKEDGTLTESLLTRIQRLV